MPTTPATGDAPTRNVEEQFLDLICHDPDLLAAEFDAIIAAEWPEPPGNGFRQGIGDGHPNRGAARCAADPLRSTASRPRHPGIGGWARQRSPPAAETTAQLTRKAGDCPT